MKMKMMEMMEMMNGGEDISSCRAILDVISKEDG